MHAITYTTVYIIWCYTCGQEDYYTKNCLSRNVKPEVVLVLDLYKSTGKSTSKLEEELKVEELGKEQP
jgi:hypothetical protein